jgi:hypothetical protein
MDSVEIGCGCVEYIGLVLDKDNWRAVVNAVMKILVPQNAGKLLRGCTNGGLSSVVKLHRVSYCIYIFHVILEKTIYLPPLHIVKVLVCVI